MKVLNELKITSVTGKINVHTSNCRTHVNRMPRYRLLRIKKKPYQKAEETQKDP
jgi:hypothetical protein